MTVKELIEALSKCRNQDAEVFIWIDGDRRAIHPNVPVDNELFDDIIDINLEEIPE